MPAVGKGVAVTADDGHFQLWVVDLERSLLFIYWAVFLGAGYFL